MSEAQALSLNAFTRKGYNFTGWTKSATGSKVYNNGQVITLTQGNDGDIIDLFAAWTIVKYTITYHLNGGNNNPANPSEYTVELMHSTSLS